MIFQSTASIFTDSLQADIRDVKEIYHDLMKKRYIQFRAIKRDLIEEFQFVDVYWAKIEGREVFIGTPLNQSTLKCPVPLKRERLDVSLTLCYHARSSI